MLNDGGTTSLLTWCKSDWIFIKSEQSNSKVGQKYGKKKVDNLWDTMPSQKPYQTVKYPAYQQHFARRKLNIVAGSTY